MIKRKFQHTFSLLNVDRVQLERAQYLIATTRMSYEEIGAQVGFNDLSYFSKAFKRSTGMSPRDYKKQMYLVGFHQ